VTKSSSDGEARESVQGEHLDVLERVVVASAAGIFRPLETVVGTLINEGDVVGLTEQRARTEPVVSRFAGRVAGWLVHPGERVREGQSVAWLRVFDQSPAILPRQP
jgi:biotin carboxyl carrier protein